MIRLLLEDVESLNDSETYFRLYENASLERRRIAEKFRFTKDRNLSIGATALMDIGLRSYGLREKDMIYGYGVNGKPFFKNAPEIHFSISHSSTKVAVAFSDKEVGCDIEQIATFDMDVAKSFFSDREYLEIMSMPALEERNREFFRYWTLKESYVKATGQGFSLSSKAFTIARNESKFVCIDNITSKIDSKFSFCSLNNIKGYLCALCFNKECGLPEIITPVF
ncbi:MAG: 4'-phosphopantetheinyl transferase superfamily protein [Alistipes sp.]|nr:4'-phosphopantetheinyl transferase superfamily protein [Candidatus Alistipes equi]